MNRICMLVSTTLLSTAALAQSGVSEWQIEMKGEQAAIKVKLEHETQPIALAFESDNSAHKFRASLHVNKLLESIPNFELTHPFQLVIDWANSSETLYVTVSRLAPPPRVEIQIDAPKQAANFRVSDLEEIEILSGGVDVMVAKYLRARRFHLHWRGMGQQTHQIAIRSARVWFDAATALSTRQQRVFRADAEINDLVDQYLATAAANPNSALAKRIHSHFPARIVSASRAQIYSAPFSVVGEIPLLISEGKIAEAKLVNSAALRTLEGGTDELREVVLATQKVNVKVLSENGLYLESLER